MPRNFLSIHPFTLACVFIIITIILLLIFSFAIWQCAACVNRKKNRRRNKTQMKTSKITAFQILILGSMRRIYLVYSPFLYSNNALRKVPYRRGVGARTPALLGAFPLLHPRNDLWYERHRISQPIRNNLRPISAHWRFPGIMAIMFFCRADYAFGLVEFAGLCCIDTANGRCNVGCRSPRAALLLVFRVLLRPWGTRFLLRRWWSPFFLRSNEGRNRECDNKPQCSCSVRTRMDDLWTTQ